MTYTFVKAGAPDYGPRKGPALGLLLHMSEGGGTVGYLSKSPARGVSVHAVCEYSGRVVQMLAWDRASGSLNPNDRSTDKAYFGQQHLMDVLGSWWTDPNSAVLSMEIEGFAAKGPNAAQVDGAVAWGEDMKTRFPSVRGALGHADQTNTKFCPGTTLAMKLIFEGVGGHGLWHPTSGPSTGGDMPDLDLTRYPEDAPRAFTTKPGLKALRRFTRSAELSPIKPPYSGYVDREVVISGTGVPHGSGFLRLSSGGSAGDFIRAPEVDVVAPAPPDCTEAVGAARKRQHDVDVAAVQAAPTT